MSSQRTPLGAVNIMIDMANKVVEEGSDPAPLQTFVEARLDELLKGREQFESNVHDLGVHFEEDYQDLIGDALGGFEAYEQAMRSMLSFFQEGKPEVLLAANDQLLALAQPLHEAVQACGQAMLAWGPSAYDEINACTNTMQAICEGKSPPAALEELVKACTDTCDRAIAEIDGNPELADDEGFQAKKKAYQDIKLALSELEPVMEESAISDALYPLQLALEAKTIAEEKIFTEMAALKPTNMPAANVLITSIRGVLEEKWDLNVVDEALEWYKRYVERIEESFDEAMQEDTTSVVILEELPRTRAIIDEHDELMENLEDALEGDFSEEMIERLLEDFIDIVERLEESSEVYLKAAEREGQLVCVKCGHANPPVNRSCESCGFRLPKLIDPTQYTATFELEERSGLEQDAEEDDYHMGVKTYRLFEACYNFFEKQISAEEFHAVIDESRETLETSRKGLSEMSAREELNERQREMLTEDELEAHAQNQEMFLETRELLEDGISEWAEGLDCMEEFISTRRRSTLEEGIQLVFVASQKIHRVQKLGEVAAEALVDLEESIRQEQRDDEQAQRDRQAALYKQDDGEAPEEEIDHGDGTLA